MQTKIHKQFKLKLLDSLLITALSGFSATTLANTAGDAEIERIEVTTQKRVQAITEVPVTVTAFNGETLEQLGIQDLDVLSDITPGLVIQEQSPNNPGFVIRRLARLLRREYSLFRRNQTC